MKDYSKTYDEKEKYILSYEKKDDQLIVKLATNKTYTIPKTRENENELLSKMKEQAKLARVKPLKLYRKILGIVQPVMLALAMISYVKIGNMPLTLILATISIGTIEYPINIIKNQIRKHEIKKINYL